MPACSAQCPIVRAQLRKAVAEAPWLLEKKRLETAVKTKDRIDLDTEEISQSGHEETTLQGSELVDDCREDVRDKTKELSDVTSSEAKSVASSRSQATQKSSTGSKVRQEEITPKTASETKSHREVDQEGRSAKRSPQGKFSASQQTVLREGGAERQEQREDVDATAEISEDPRQASQRESNEISETREGSKIYAEERIRSKLTWLSFRIERTIDRLERRQKILDAYITKKGLNYFDDVCTCSLSCILRALRHDPFLRSILVSTVFFTLGFKLCLELDAWYLPSRSS